MRHSLPSVIELELWSRPGSCLPPEIGKLEIAPLCSRELALREGIVLGLSEIPDPAHSQSLAVSLACGELSRRAFAGYCVENGLAADVQSMESAARFLEHSYGRALAWVHLEASSTGLEIGERINSWAHSQGYCLQEPCTGVCFLNGVSLHHLLPHDA